jgi:Sulfotransferase domain
MYGRQVADLLDHFARDQLLLLRYAELVQDPTSTLAKVSAFLGVGPPEVAEVPADNARVFVSNGPRTRALSSVIRTGASIGQFFPPQVWRRASLPLVRQLHRGGQAARPKLTPQQRNELLKPHLEDIALLEQVTGQSYQDWLGYRDGGTFQSRRIGQDVIAAGAR